MLEGCTNVDMVGVIDSRKFTSRYLMTFSGESYFLVVQALEMCCSINHGGRVHSSDRRVQGDVVGKETS